MDLPWESVTAGLKDNTAILTAVGIVGCGIYDVIVPAKFNQALAIAEGPPDCPLVTPEDLLDAKIVRYTPVLRAWESK